jgi:hypothetical protein
MLQRLRHPSTVTRVLTLFAICLVAKLVATWVSPTAVQQICSATKVVKLVVAQADGSPSSDTGRHEGGGCPSCALPVLPVAPQHALLPPASGLAHFSRSLPAACLAALVGAPLPPRGPPAIV